MSNKQHRKYRLIPEAPRSRHHSAKSGQHDWWHKADIISKFVASVVIAGIGILITWAIQHSQIETTRSTATAQIETAKLKAQDDKRLQEGQLTAVLVQHLTSKDAAQREIAIIALRESVPSNIYDKVLEVIIRSDPNVDVRKAAIQQLGTSINPIVTSTLNSIAQDPTRSTEERTLAAQSTRKVAISSSLGVNTFIFAASTEAEVMESTKLGQAAFTHFLLKGLGGEADLNQDGNVAASELASYLNQQVPAYTQIELGVRQQPIAAFNGPTDTPLIGTHADYSEIVGLVIGIAEYSDSNLRNLHLSAGGAKSFYDFLQNKSGAHPTKLQLLINGAATRSNILKRLDQIEDELKPDSLLVIYYAGHGVLDKEGQASWLTHDSRVGVEDTYLGFNEIKAFLQRTKAKAKAVYVDTSFAGRGLLD